LVPYLDGSDWKIWSWDCESEEEDQNIGESCEEKENENLKKYMKFISIKRKFLCKPEIMLF
jgi:hypothetical protein